jgi:Cu(I)/Ag(I) efflux system periplasmic protein CusF
MNAYSKTLAALLTATAVSMSFSMLAHAAGDHGKPGMEHGKMGMTAAPDMTDGEIRKIDKEQGKITIKHAEIKNLDMPPMSMVFSVKDKAMLDKVQVGEKIQFVVIMDAGKMVVTDIKPSK